MLIFKFKPCYSLINALSPCALLSLFIFISLASVPAPLIDLSSAEIKSFRKGRYSLRRPIVIGYVLILKNVDLFLIQSSASDPPCCNSSSGGQRNNTFCYIGSALSHRLTIYKLFLFFVAINLVYWTLDKWWLFRDSHGLLTTVMDPVIIVDHSYK